MSISDEIKEACLDDWNHWHADLWMKLVCLRKVEKNDCEAFIRFSCFFRKFFDEHGRPPYISEATKELA